MDRARLSDACFPKVDTVRERIVLYILNIVIYRKKEMTEEIPFLCHGEKDHVKILWDDGEAVGFYSVKATGMQPQRFTTLILLLSAVAMWAMFEHPKADHGKR